MSQVELYKAGDKYVEGLSTDKHTATILRVFPGIARDSLNQNDLVLEAAMTDLDFGVVGANGLDTGSIGASKIYAIYIIGDSSRYQPTATIASLNTTTPSLPQGYDIYRRISWVFTSGASSILKMLPYGNGRERIYYHDERVAVLTNGNDTSYTAIDCSAGVPPIATEILFSADYTANGATNVAEFRAGASLTSNRTQILGFNTTGAISTSFWMCSRVVSSASTVEYKVDTSDDLDLFVVAFKDFL